MTKGVRLAFFVFSLVLLLGVSYLTTGSLIPMGKSDIIWFSMGGLMILLGSFLVEYFYTSPGDVLVNTSALALSIFLNGLFPTGWHWQSIVIGSAILFLLATLSILLGEPYEEKNATLQYVARIFMKVSTKIGRSTVLFSIAFLLAVNTVYGFEKSSIPLYGFWVLVTLLRTFPKEILDVLKLGQPSGTPLLGRVLFHHAPKVLFGEVLTEKERLSFGDVVIISNDYPSMDDGQLGLIIEIISLRNRRLVRIYRLDDREDQSTPAKFFKIKNPSETVSDRLMGNLIWENRDKIVGLLDKGSMIGLLKVEVLNHVELETGVLVEAKVGDTNVIYQVTNATIWAESIIEGNKVDYKLAEAQQLGVWDSKNLSFNSYGWLPEENSLIFKTLTEPITHAKPEKMVHIVGKIPKSSFPVCIDLQKLVVLHTAILGTTGSGKTYLALELIEELIKRNVKVICVDRAGEYRRRLRDEALDNIFEIETTDQVTNFLQSDKLLGLYEFAACQTDVDVANSVATIMETVSRWCEDNHGVLDFNEAKLCVVLEEAHNLIPEYMFTTKDTSDIVNRVSRDIFQCRKLGIGVVLVTQRTANVSKSILTQCNTIFSFSVYDNTSLDLLANYMGSHFTTVFSNLKKRQIVLVGSASLIDRPVILELTEIKRPLRELTAGEEESGANTQEEDLPF